MEEKKNANKTTSTTKKTTRKTTTKEEKIGEKFLPIGTVAMLKGGSKRVMIAGFCSMDEKNPTKIWDYSGCMYPEGFLSSNQTCLFDHEQIEKVYHIGLIDEEEEKFKKSLKELLESKANT